MATTSITAPGVSPVEVIERARLARQAERRGAADQLVLALTWARLHPCPADEVPAHWGEVAFHGEGLCPLAGVGAPWVAEFAPADFGAALGILVEAAKQLLGDALELAHRLPRLWALVQNLAVPAWRARLIARETRDLSKEAARFADRLISAVPDKIGSVNAARLVQEARLYFDPDRATADEDEALARRGVWSRPGAAGPATTEMWMTLDTPDAELFDQSLSRIASDLKELGDAASLDVRRARAVGVLADPQYALDLMSGREGLAPTSNRGGVANLFVHLTPEDLEAEGNGEPGAVTIERLGAATTRLLTDWLARLAGTGGKVILRPVIDLTTTHTAETAVDRHDPPAAMREQVVLRDAHCVFPGCHRDSRACDLDHIEPYLGPDDGGPPGQTHPGNLAPLCRRHHRVKTHTAWDYERLDDGSYSWTAPTGHQYETPPSNRRPHESDRRPAVTTRPPRVLIPPQRRRT
ncbi:MAG: hypothetical protein ABIN79_13515 [Marmoricola sp.]